MNEVVNEQLSKVESDLDTSLGYLEDALQKMRDLRAKRDAAKIMTAIESGAPVERIFEKMVTLDPDRRADEDEKIELDAKTKELVELATQFIDGALTPYDFVTKVGVVGEKIQPGEYDI